MWLDSQDPGGLLSRNFHAFELNQVSGHLLWYNQATEAIYQMMEIKHILTQLKSILKISVMVLLL